VEQTSRLDDEGGKSTIWHHTDRPPRRPITPSLGMSSAAVHTALTSALSFESADDRLYQACPGRSLGLWYQGYSAARRAVENRAVTGLSSCIDRLRVVALMSRLYLGEIISTERAGRILLLILGVILMGRS
jgi:hypothetical protein